MAILLLAMPMIIMALVLKTTSKGPFLYWSDPKGGNMAEHPEEKPNSDGLFALCAGVLIGLMSGIFIGWIIWG
ncbi:MAG: hypothetical protein WA133_03265 [Syntrophales bacterium]